MTPSRSVPDGISKPDWASTGVPEEEMNSKHQSNVPVRTQAELDAFQAACELGREILDEAHRHVKPGVTTDEIDRVRHDSGPGVHLRGFEAILWPILSCSTRDSLLSYSLSRPISARQMARFPQCLFIVCLFVCRFGDGTGAAET